MSWSSMNYNKVSFVLAGWHGFGLVQSIRHRFRLVSLFWQGMFVLA